MGIYSNMIVILWDLITTIHIYSHEPDIEKVVPSHKKRILKSLDMGLKSKELRDLVSPDISYI